jgi:hypothetical protein
MVKNFSWLPVVSSALLVPIGIVFNHGGDDIPDTDYHIGQLDSACTQQPHFESEEFKKAHRS